MDKPFKILIVEDEMIIAANISTQLSLLGYEVTGIIPRGEEALLHIQENMPDIVLLDIQLKGEINGIETARRMQEYSDVAVVYLTANADDTHFNQAKDTHPYAFISKPFKKLDLQRAIELTTTQLLQKSEHKESTLNFKHETDYVLSNYLFVRDHDKLVKVAIDQINYIEADRNYSKICADDKEYTLVQTLKQLDDKLPPGLFMRVHRSFIINIANINEVGTSHLVVGKKAIPISKILKDELLKRLQTL